MSNEWEDQMQRSTTGDEVSTLFGPHTILFLPSASHHHPPEVVIITLSNAALMGQLTPVTPRIARASASTSPAVAGTGTCVHNKCVAECVCGGAIADITTWVLPPEGI